MFDQETRRLEHTLVRNVGSKRYFNRVEADGQDPDQVENALSQLEGELAKALSEVIEAREFPSDQHFSSVINLAALLSVRNPRKRLQMERFHQEIVEKTFGVLVSSKEVWERQTQKMRDDGVEVNEDVAYEDIKRLREEKKYTVKIDQSHLIGVEFEMVPPVLETMARRSWCFASAPEGNQYITSDDPVVLEWSDNRDYGPLTSPGHGLRGTNIIFPVSSDLVLIGSFEETPHRLEHTEAQVTSVNTVVARNSGRQIYARSDQFRLYLRGQSIAQGAELPRLYGR
jgi:hypothetical protein